MTKDGNNFLNREDLLDRIKKTEDFQNDTVEIFTDGACSGNPGPGGWAALLRWQGQEKTLSGGCLDTTNNRMELLATIHAIESLKRPMRIVLSTDSSYVQKGMTQWLPSWKLRRWNKVKNPDLWKRLVTACEQHTIKWLWVKGHDGHAENIYCDKVARQVVAEIKGR